MLIFINATYSSLNHGITYCIYEHAPGIRCMQSIKNDSRLEREKAFLANILRVLIHKWA